MSYSPSPWTFNGTDVTAKNGTYYICFADKDTYNTPEETAEEIANCTLIAAAPELLETCIELLKCLKNAPERGYERNLLETIIKKATT